MKEKERKILRYLERLLEEEKRVKDFYLEKLEDCSMNDEDYYEDFLIKSNEKVYLLKDIVETVKEYLDKE